MADLSDVESALVAAVTNAVYPNGLDQSSVLDKPVRIYRGWPLTSPLDADLAAGVSNVSVFPLDGATRNTTRWAPLISSTAGMVTLSVSTAGASATFSGVGGEGQLAGLLVDGAPFVYRGKAGDTPALVAAVLADAVRQVRPCWLSRTTVSVPGAVKFIARVVCDGILVTEWARQEQGFRVSTWCPTPALRDTLCTAIGGVLASTAFLTLADGTSGRLRYRSTTSVDEAQDAHLYRRDLVFDVEYGTTAITNAPAMLFGDLMLSGASIYG